MDRLRSHRRIADTTALVVIGAAAVTMARCGPVEEPAAAIDPVEARVVLGHLAQRVVLPGYERFAAVAATLEAATEGYASTLGEGDRDAARAAWIEAMDAWQRLEMMQLGPAAPTSRPGGRALRDEIDSWPLTNECRIDQEIVEGAYVDPDAFAMELVNVRGLDAMEYLLFHEGPDNSCSPESTINATGTWAALAPAEIRRRRADYAATLAYLVRVQADALVHAFQPAGEDFAGLLARSDERPYPDPRTGLNAISDALFYLDLFTKDRKLTATQREDVESPHALRSREHVLTNLAAFEEVFLGAPPGTDAPGMDDLLRLVGEDAMADRIEGLLREATASVEAIEPPLAVAVTERPDEVAAAHEAVRRVTDELKGRFLTALTLSIPAEAGGDTD